MAALKKADWNSLVELVNLATYSNVTLSLPPVRLAGYQGWPALGGAIGQHYVQDITKNQVWG